MSTNQSRLRSPIDRMPIKPDQVSAVEGPLMNVKRVDDHTVDVTMTTSFRAHFAEPIPQVAAAPAVRAVQVDSPIRLTLG